MIKDKKDKQSSGGSSGSSNSSGSNNSKSNNNNANNASNTNSASNNASTSSPSSSKTSNSRKESSNSGNSSNSSTSKNIHGIKEEIIEQSKISRLKISESDFISQSDILGSSEQLVVTSIKHEDGSPPTNIIKKEPVPSSSSSTSGASTSSNVNSNDSNNNNDTNDNKNSNSSGNLLLPDEKDPINDNSITDECKFHDNVIPEIPMNHFDLSVLNNDDLSASGSGNNSNSNKLGMHIKSEDPATDPLAGVDSSLNNSNFGPMNPNNPSGTNRSIMSQNSPDRIQPLPSNVVNKQSNSMDVSTE